MSDKIVFIADISKELYRRSKYFQEVSSNLRTEYLVTLTAGQRVTKRIIRASAVFQNNIRLHKFNGSQFTRFLKIRENLVSL